MTQLRPAEALLVEALKADPDVVAQVGSASRIATRLGGTYPAIRLTLLAGSRRLPGTGSAELQVEAWGNGSTAADQTKAEDIALAVEAAAEDLSGDYSAGRIVGSWAFALIHVPDAVTHRERYLLTVGIMYQ